MTRPHIKKELVAIPHRYAPRGGCKHVIESRAGEVLLSGPAGTGKSRACLEKIHMMALLNPGMKALIVRKTLASLGASALATWREKVVPEALMGGLLKYYGGSQQESPQYVYANGSKVLIGGMDKPIRVMSTEYDIIYVQEAIELTETDWESLTTRLRHGRVGFQQLLADTNPDTPTHWLYERCNRGSTILLESRHEDNPVLFDDAGRLTSEGERYLGVLDKLTGVRHARLRKGLWVAAEGIIYEQWDPAIHFIDGFRPPMDWPRFWAVDFGFTNPFVCQWWAMDPDGRLYLYREIYHTQRRVEQHAEKMLKSVLNRAGDWREPQPEAIICDHDAEGREVLSDRLGLSTTAAVKAVKDGIEAVQSRLEPAGDGKPRLMIMRDALVDPDRELRALSKPSCTAEEIPGYVWAPDPRSKTGGRKEEPLKENDHGCDAMRYLVAHHDLGWTPNVRWL